MSKSVRKVPEIRFKGFSEAWEQRKLEDLSQYSNGGSYENDVQEKGKYELITLKSVDMDGKLVHSGRYIDIEVPTLVKGTLVMILSEQSPGLLGMTAQIPMDNKYVLNQRVAEIRPNQDVDSYFLSMMINKNQQYFSKHGAGTKVQNISKPNVERFKFSCPIFHEQQIIGTFFNHLDNLITLHQRKLELLKQLKQGYLQNMFPQQGESMPKLRFADFDSVWEQRKLGEVVQITMGQSPNGVNYTENPNDHILVQGNADIKNGWVNPRVWTTQITKTADKGNIILSVRAPVGDVGKTQYNVVLGRGVAGIKGNEFIFQLLQKMKGNKLWKRYSTGSTFESINSRDLKEAIIVIPDNNEQVIIGCLLKQLDNTISLQQTKLEKIQTLKKACLQKMFI